MRHLRKMTAKYSASLMLGGALALGSAALVTGCEEDAGDTVQDAADATGDAIDDAGDAVRDAVDDAGDAVDDAVDG